MTETEIIDQATDIANEIERAMHGMNSAACHIAIGMVIAHFIAMGKIRDTDGTFRVLRNVTEGELQRQFSQ